MNAKVIRFPACANLSAAPMGGIRKLLRGIARLFRKPEVIKPRRRASRSQLIVSRAMRDWK